MEGIHPQVDARRIDEVIAFEELPLGSLGSRQAVVRWSDGTTSEVGPWYDDEILICEGDLIGKTAADITNIIFRRDRDYLPGAGETVGSKTPLLIAERPSRPVMRLGRTLKPFA